MSFTDTLLAFGTKFVGNLARSLAYIALFLILRGIRIMIEKNATKGEPL